MIKKLIIGMFAALAIVSLTDHTFPAQRDEVIAVITELKFNNGDIQIMNPGKSALEKPAVLQSLYAGSRVQASKNAVAVILFTDGSNVVRVEEKNSPMEIKATAKGAQAGGKLKEAANLLVGKKNTPSLVALAVRGKTRGPTLLTPRASKLTTTTPNFQWMGMEGQPSTIKVFSPDGVIWSAENVALTQANYPSSAPALQPGVSYAWSVERRGVPPEKAAFSIASAEDARTTQEQLAGLSANANLSKTTLAILKGSFLISREFYYDAREILLEAAKSDPDEPTLHFLLGEVYDRTGLKSLAQEEYSEAQLLTTRKP